MKNCICIYTWAYAQGWKDRFQTIGSGYLQVPEGKKSSQEAK